MRQDEPSSFYRQPVLGAISGHLVVNPRYFVLLKFHLSDRSLRSRNLIAMLMGSLAASSDISHVGCHPSASNKWKV